MRAERLLAAATAQQGVATAEFFPHLILGGAAGVQSQKTSNLFSQHDPAPASIPLDRSRAGRSSTAGGDARTSISPKPESSRRWRPTRATVLAALRDVESSLTAYSHDQARRESLIALVAQNQEAVRIAQKEYETG